MVSDGRRVVLVTGTSSGIGLATALALSGLGWRVIATVRDTPRAGELTKAAARDDLDVDVWPLDVTDNGSIDDLYARVRDTHRRLDALVNNAGATTVGTAETLSMDDVRAIMEVNFFGVVAMTRQAMPLLRESGGRLVTVTSVGGVVGQPFNDAYCAAKFATEGFMESLAPVAATVGVRVCVVEPGAVASRFIENAELDVDRMLADAGAYRPALQAYLDRTLSRFDPAAAQSPADVADVIGDLLDHPAPPLRTQTSTWARDFAAVKLADLDGSAVTSMTAGWVGG